MHTLTTDHYPPACDLRSESIVNPIGLEERRPRLSWRAPWTHAGAQVTRVHVTAARSPHDLEAGSLLWDSGERVGTDGDSDIAVTYGGPDLNSRERVWWRVRLWDERKRPTAWSEPAWFEMGLLNESDWQGSWVLANGIGCPLFRCPFRLQQPAGEVARARWHVTGLGFFEPRLNGSKIGDQARAPEYTDYWKRVAYSTFDVAASLRDGENVLGVALGGGYFERLGFGSSRLRSQLEIVYADGAVQVVGDSFTAWHAAPGPWRAADIYHGETYDARLWPDGWDGPGFDEQGRWSVTEAPNNVGIPERLTGLRCGPERVTGEISPVAMREVRPGVHIVDFGRVFGGWARLEAEGDAGTEVRMHFAELCHEDGTLDPRSVRAIEATDRYTLRGGGRESWEPSFTRHGFRYVEVTGVPQLPRHWQLVGRLAHNELPHRGTFACSDERLNRLHQAVENTLLANASSVPSDCPQRNERQGWFGDAHLAAEAMLHHRDARGFYDKWMADIRDTFDAETGALPAAMAPPWYLGGRPSGRIHRGEENAVYHYTVAATLIPWYVLLYDDDREFAARYLDIGLRNLDFLMARPGAPFPAQDQTLSDWLFVGAEQPNAKCPTSYIFVGAAHLLYQARCLAAMTRLLDREEEHVRLTTTCGRIAAALAERFYDRTKGTFGSQSADAMALRLDFVPEGERARVVESLVADLCARDCHLSTGIFGTRHLFDALCENGRFDVAWRVLTAEGYPSYMEMLENGATTITERWVYKGYWDMNSHCHPAFGSIGAWLFRWLVGIRVDAEAPGYRHFVVAPETPAELTWAEGELLTARGRLAARWDRTPQGVRVAVTVPPSCEATVRVGAHEPVRVAAGAHELNFGETQ
jgi:alpha-L-rhamnosidase